ncbi:MAG TPA: response regulator transcription factor [Bacteroidales bacterium]|nr:response regulator transcription factor [Bacteroidales bacterium]HPS73428.1 response regulator transcription factor [Bacteroidales bacterium]
MEKKNKILLVEDDPNFGSILKSYLELNDFEVTLKEDGKQGLSAFQSFPFDICICDVMMPEMDGFTLAREIRKLNKDVPLIFLTAKTLKSDVIEGFRTGADDYLTKPFDSELLMYKIRAILKRSPKEEQTAPTLFRIGKFSFNYPLRSLESADESFRLSPKESDLLMMLCTAKNGILLRKEALEHIWEADTYFTTRSMDVFIARLRKYFKSDPEIEIANIHGNGFRLVGLKTDIAV